MLAKKSALAVSRKLILLSLVPGPMLREDRLDRALYLFFAYKTIAVCTCNRGCQ